MNGSTLKALRSLLFFTQDEAAALVGGVSLRSWQYWEVDRRTIPQDVVEKMSLLVAWRDQAISAGVESCKKMIESLPKGAEYEPISIVTYGSADDWMTLPDREPILWKPHCSVVAEIVAKVDGRAVLFDAPAYAKWLGKRKDSESMRSAWAASI